METSAIAFKCRPFAVQMEKLQEFFEYYYTATPDKVQKERLLECIRGMRAANKAVKEIVDAGP